MAYTGASSSPSSIDDRKRAKGSRDALTIGEWNAVATSKREARTCRSRSAASARSMAAVAPLRTTCSGWLWFATVTSRPASITAARTTSIAALTASIAPSLDAASAIRSPRSRATRTRSRSLSAPAAKSAVTSPKLCPP